LMGAGFTDVLHCSSSIKALRNIPSAASADAPGHPQIGVRNTLPELHLAAIHEDCAKIESLLLEGTDVDTRDSLGRKAQEVAVIAGKAANADMLVGAIGTADCQC
jgi:hypothetical protein